MSMHSAVLRTTWKPYEIQMFKQDFFDVYFRFSGSLKLKKCSAELWKAYIMKFQSKNKM